MTTNRPTILLVLVLILTLVYTDALSTPLRPRGSAARPLDKKKVAVFGAGGYLGANIFGFLQRASNLYGTGIAGSTSPRHLCATSVSSASMNKVLGKNFCLAYAGEQHVTLTDMTRVEAIAARLKDYAVVVMGTMYDLEQRPVTGGSYEKSPNDKTLEFYLDQPRKDPAEVEFDFEIHLNLFENTLQACQDGNVEHVVVIETPKTKNEDEFISRLMSYKIPFTYIRLNGGLQNSLDYTHWKGVQGDLSIEATPISQLSGLQRDTNQSPIYREDLAALVCQSIQSLSWSESRCLQVSSNGEWDEAIKVVKGRQDREWCANSKVLAAKLASIQ